VSHPEQTDALDDQRLGLAIRALRRRRGWRQADLAAATDVSRSSVSIVERGHLDRTSIRTLRAVVGALDARLDLAIRWRGGELDRVLDSDHARLVAAISDRLRVLGWAVAIEATYSTYGERGSIDVLGFHEGTGALLVIEVKTELISAEQTLRKLDEKVRLAPSVALRRLNWSARHVSRLLVIEDASTARRRIDRHAALFEIALPARGAVVRRWLVSPLEPIAGIAFLSPGTGSSGIQSGGGRHRVRRSSGRVATHGKPPTEPSSRRFPELGPTPTR
jgi:transcriptional regulator with XRE-family HTH domain